MMMRETALSGEFPASLVFEDIEPEVLAEEDAGPFAGSPPDATSGGWPDPSRPWLPPDMQRSPSEAALFLCSTRTALGAKRYAAALQTSAAIKDDLARVRFWHDVLVELGRIAARS